MIIIINHHTRMDLFNYPKFWFYVRKAIFQGLCPIILGFFTFYDLTGEARTINKFNLYYGTSIIFLVYSQLRILLEYIFSICSEMVILKKEINLDNSLGALSFSEGAGTLPGVQEMIDIETTESNDLSDNDFIVITKRIYKLRYSDSKLFRFIDRVCWLTGIDSPILIPLDTVRDLIGGGTPLNKVNEQSILNKTLHKLCQYHPVPVEQGSPSSSKYSTSELGEPLLVSTSERTDYTPKDKVIIDIKKALDI